MVWNEDAIIHTSSTWGYPHEVGYDHPSPNAMGGLQLQYDTETGLWDSYNVLNQVNYSPGINHHKDEGTMPHEPPPHGSKHENVSRSEQAQLLSSEKEKKEVDNLPQRIKAQVEYYFSEKNLQHDDFLQGLMDSQGWVKARFLEQFPRLKTMEAKSVLIVASVLNSDIVEVSDGKIRRKNDWQKYLPSQEAVSNRLLEGMAVRIEDHCTKVQRFKTRKSSKNAKEKSSLKKEEGKKISSPPNQEVLSTEKKMNDNLPVKDTTETSQHENNQNTDSQHDDANKEMELID